FFEGELKRIIANVETPAAFHNHVAQKVVAEHQVVFAILTKVNVAADEVETVLQLGGVGGGETRFQLVHFFFAAPLVSVMEINRIGAVLEARGEGEQIAGTFAPAGSGEIEFIGGAVAVIGEP